MNNANVILSFLFAFFLFFKYYKKIQTALRANWSDSFTFNH